MYGLVERTSLIQQQESLRWSGTWVKALTYHYPPHKLRHSFAISFLRNGANPFELQIALGHTTLEMTRRYTQALGFEDVFKRHIMASPVDRLVR